MPVPIPATDSVESISHGAEESTASAAQTNGVNHDDNSEPLEEDSVDTDATGLNERSQRHLVQLEEFRNRLNRAANSMIEKRKAYRRVVALITVWEKAPGLEHMEKHARRLHDLLKDTYKFETEFYTIPKDADLLEFTSRFSGTIKTVRDDEQSLLIFYYGGHGMEDSKNNTMLIKSGLGNSAGSLDFITAQKTMFGSTRCDKLFLLDCCHSGDMISRDVEWQNATELLGASSKSATASSRISSSFTRALVDELKEPGYDIWTLWSALSDRKKMDDYGLAADPYYFDYSGHHLPPISMQTFDIQHTKKCDVGALARSCSNARMLIKVTFRSDAQNLLTSWQNFFSHSPHEVAEYKFAAHMETTPTLVALFESNSCTAIITLPVWLWAGMIAGAKGYEALAIIRSDNFVDQLTRAHEIVEAPRDITNPSAARAIETGKGATSHDDLQIEPGRAVPSPSPAPKYQNIQHSSYTPYLPERAMQAELEKGAAIAPISRPQEGRWRMKLQNEVDPDELERKIGKIGPPLKKIEKGATKSVGPGFESPKSTRFSGSFWRKPYILPVTPSHHPLRF